MRKHQVNIMAHFGVGCFSVFPWMGVFDFDLGLSAFLYERTC